MRYRQYSLDGNLINIHFTTGKAVLTIFTEGHVTYDGSLSACCFDHDGRFNMGDLTTTPFLEAWNSAPFQKLRTANLAKDVTGTACEKCIAHATHDIAAPRASELTGEREFV